LSTAYYLGGEIMIMCKGRVIERGDMDTIVSHPSHPYTQLLIESVPSSDPSQRWKERRGVGGGVETAALKTEGGNACIFTSRCPRVMDICHTKRPEFIQISPEQDSACFLYDKAVVPQASQTPAKV
ncbi:MAG: oligopeptide/dipeptide ABC transporter ATP-binding protein, partial [Chloroflexota bacterium]